VANDKNSSGSVQTKTTSFAAISDLHQFYPNYPLREVDCLIVAGDVFQGTLIPEERMRSEIVKQDIVLQGNTINSFVDYLSELPVKQVIIVAGNNDYLFEQIGCQLSNGLLKHLMSLFAKEKQLTKTPKITYLENQSMVFNGLKIGGTPYSSLHPENLYPKKRAFTVSEQEYQEKVIIPHNTDIVISHSSPNLADSFQAPDSIIAANHLEQQFRASQAQVMVCGHFHWMRGEFVIGDKKVINASAVNPYSDKSDSGKPITGDPYFYFSLKS
jgi:Icc-related predicted phosphoesterase